MQEGVTGLGAASMSAPACLILQVSLPCPKLETQSLKSKTVATMVGGPKTFWEDQRAGGLKRSQRLKFAYFFAYFAFHSQWTESDFKDWGWKIQYIAKKAISVVLVFMVVMSWRVTAIVQSLALFNREAQVFPFGIVVMVPIVDTAVERTLFSFLNIFSLVNK